MFLTPSRQCALVLRKLQNRTEQFLPSKNWQARGEPTISVSPIAKVGALRVGVLRSSEHRGLGSAFWAPSLRGSWPCCCCRRTPAPSGCRHGSRWPRNKVGDSGSQLGPISEPGHRSPLARSPVQHTAADLVPDWTHVREPGWLAGLLDGTFLFSKSC